MKDRRLDEANSNYVVSDLSGRPSVDVMIERYAAVVNCISSKKSKVIRLTKRQGKTKSGKLTLTSSVRQRLNKELPRIRQLSEHQGSFTASDFCKLLSVSRAIGNKYLKILLASDHINTDGKSWRATYTWRGSARTCLR